ncbi:MAG: 30S ribosomal protein S17 [Leptospiraceae bacterium]|nr:30S ribosomal protein S17 [Leptospiraceae bacterium]MCK6380138.1 30S ribosomal protein S17 [Leptospiraceae bacterium]NUM42716.1 30S ribosomal protein S17 [Leptospiraceae bacterium]
MKDTKPKNQKTVQGKVVSAKMDKTVVIEIETMQTHPLFKKITRKTHRLKVHDEKRECREGDRIIAQETIPLSKEKRHKLLKIVEKAK